MEVQTEARLPTRNSFQHPLSDTWFSHARAIMEACAIDSGGCEECDLQHNCRILYDRLSNKGCDSYIGARNFLDFVIKYSELILGERIVPKNDLTKKNSTINFSTVVNGTPVYTCTHCNWVWISRLEKLPDQCPNCHSDYWNKPKRNGNGQ